MEYFFNCECGRQLSVTAGQAGTLQQCTCGRRVAAPPLSELVNIVTTVPVEPPRSEDGWFIRMSLNAGVLSSIVGCVAAIPTAVWTMFTVSGWYRWLAFFWGVVGFFYSAGMIVVFQRARR